MDPIITQWNSECVSGPGGVVFLMQKQNEAHCVVYAPCRKKCLSDFWHQTAFGCREALAAEPDRSIFLQSMSVCQVERIFTASLLHLCVLMWNVSGEGLLFSFFLLAHRAEKQMPPSCLTLPKPLWELCVCARADILSPSVFLCHIKLVRGWERGC